MYCDTMSVLVHTVSQLLYRWFALSSLSVSNSGVEGVFDFLELSKEDWKHVCNLEIKRHQLSSKWAKAYLDKYRDDGSYLAQVIFDNIQNIVKNQANYIPFFDTRYPELLKMIEDYPTGLITLGDLSLLSRECVSIIGSRKASGFALNESYKLGYGLALKNYVIVSGGAIGCDIAAHDGALASQLSNVPVVVVFAGGLRQFYPRQNYKSFIQLRQRNALFISERLWDQPARAFDFPVRNRIIAGLSGKTIVMQANIKSGAMITAKTALDQGRDVYVLLHDQNDVRADGNLELFKQGAVGFTSAEGFLRGEFYAY